MNDNQRGISERFFHDLKKGVLRQITEECKRNSELLFIRDGYTNVYHKGRSLIKIEEQERLQRYLLSFDFNYARYLEHWQDALEKLNLLGFTLPDGWQKIGGHDLVSSIPFDGSFIACESAFKILRGLIDDYLRPCNGKVPKHDYFKEHDKVKQPLRCQPCYLEKRRQQEIALANRRLGEGYCIYDIEYAQPRDSKAEENLGRYDLLALRYQDGSPAALVFIELKSTRGACTGKSGIMEHDVALQKYLGTENAKQRFAEAEKSIRQLWELGLLEGDAPDCLPKELPLEALFIFTDDAKYYSGCVKNSVETGEQDSWQIR